MNSAAPTNPPALRALDITATYPGQSRVVPALSRVNLSIQRGERLLLLGANGAGKTTFIRVFAGLLSTVSGQAQVFGQAPKDARRLIGVVTHHPLLYEELTASENLRLHADLFGVPDGVDRGVDLLDRLGIATKRNERVGRLSRGQQQRVAIARALLHEPPVLLLDEPETGLDAAAVGRLEEIALTPDRAVVLTTHNLHTGLRLATRAAILARGRIAYAADSVTIDDERDLAERMRRLAESDSVAA